VNTCVSFFVETVSGDRRNSMEAEITRHQMDRLLPNLPALKVMYMLVGVLVEVVQADGR